MDEVFRILARGAVKVNNMKRSGHLFTRVPPHHPRSKSLLIIMALPIVQIIIFGRPSPTRSRMPTSGYWSRTG